MAQKFLSDLLQIANIVPNQVGDRCAICLEAYGRLSSDTGTIEIGIRLPCDHSIGSACIATWLKDNNNNTCPICRREFFPAQHSLAHEHEDDDIIIVMDDSESEHDDDNDGDNDEEGGPLQHLADLVGTCCLQLSLSADTAEAAGLMALKLAEEERWLGDGHHTHRCIVAVSIYIASHIMHELRSPREIATVTGVEADHIRDSYDLIYPEREQLVRARHAEEEDLSGEEGESPSQCCWPRTGFELTDEQIESPDLWQTLREGCEEGCEELGLDAPVVEFSVKVAGKLFTARLLGRLSPNQMVAVSIYMAAHMSCVPLHPRRVAEAVDISLSGVCSAYETAYSYQQLLLGQQWLVGIGGGSVEGVLDRLPLP